jgi:hypothetical protein
MIPTPATPEVRDELARIASLSGVLTEEAVVEASKDEASPLHRFFLWDNPDRAAHLGRLEIARQLIVRVRIEPFEAEQMKCSPEVRRYHGTGEGQYLDVRTIMADEGERRKLLARALAELRGLKKRYSELKELTGVFQAVDALKEAV